MILKKLIIGFFIILLGLSSVTLYAQFSASGQSNPFVRGDNSPQPAPQKEFKKSSGFFSGIWRNFVAVQKDMNATLSKKITDIKNNFSTMSIIIIILISIAYGAFHALGPGHGKVVISTYILREDVSIKQTLILSIIAAITHVFSALILGVIFGLISNLSIIDNQETTRRYAMLASGILIANIGIYLAVRSYRQKQCACGEIKEINQGQKWRIALLGISTGIVPCPVSLAIVIFGIYIKAVLFVVIAIIGISIGTAVTIFILALMVLKVKKGALNLTEKKGRRVERFQRYLEYFSSAFIILFGIFIALTFFQ